MLRLFVANFLSYFKVGLRLRSAHLFILSGSMKSFIFSSSFKSDLWASVASRFYFVTYIVGMFDLYLYVYTAPFGL